MKTRKVEEIVKTAISTQTKEVEAKLIKVLNTENFNGRTNGLPFLSYESFLKNKKEYLDLWLLIETLKSVFNQIFKWKGLSKKENRKLEELLFLNGKVAIVKLPEDMLYITEYSCEEGQYDNYGYPKAITIIDKNNKVMNNKKFTKDFAVIFNHISKQSLIYLTWNRLLSYLEALRRLDVVNRTSDMKILVSENADDLMFQDLNAKWYSEEPFLKVNGELFSSERFEQIALTDNAKIKEELLLFHLDLILTYLGFKTGNLSDKQERQTELEVANNDKFNGLILENMYEMRLEGQEEIKEKLGLNITIEEPKLLKEETNKDEINGEENKKEINNE